MPVHQLGLPADMDAFAELERRHGLTIVEDAACAIGATLQGTADRLARPVACFSLHPRKVITTGEGGMITVARSGGGRPAAPAPAHAMERLRPGTSQRRRSGLESYPERGFNSRMTDMQAALGLCQLEALDEILAPATHLAERYNRDAQPRSRHRAPVRPAARGTTWQSYCVRIDPQAGIDRSELMSRLLADGVATRRGVMAIHHERAYERHNPSPSRTLRRRRMNTLMLPLFPDLTEAQQDYVSTGSARTCIASRPARCA